MFEILKSRKNLQLVSQDSHPHSFELLGSYQTCYPMSSVVINIFDMMNPGDLLRRICSTNENCSCWAMSSQWKPCSVIWSGCCLWKCLIDWPCLLFNISDIKSFHPSGVEWFCEPAACCSSAFNLQENKCSCWVPVLSTRGHSKTVTLKRRVHWLMVNWWTTVVCVCFHCIILYMCYKTGNECFHPPVRVAVDFQSCFCCPFYRK